MPDPKDRASRSGGTRPQKDPSLPYNASMVRRLIGRGASELPALPEAVHASEEEPLPWKTQRCYPRDQFESCTMTIEQWLANTDEDVFVGKGDGVRGRTSKWRVLIDVCTLVKPGLDSSNGLRQEPRVGYDPCGDQLFFLFKASTNGITYLVSPEGLDLGEEEIIPCS